MECPKCNNLNSKVLESRPSRENQAIRRRRECVKCGFRYSTYEQVEVLDLTVIKRDGRREVYSFDKLHSGVLKAFEKRPSKATDLQRFSESIEREIQKKAKNGEIKSADIGNIVIKRLRRKDPIAYVRFASVYLQFQNISDFKEALNNLPKGALKKIN